MKYNSPQHTISLENAAIIYAPYSESPAHLINIQDAKREAFIDGANWQKERLLDDLKNIYNETSDKAAKIILPVIIDKLQTL